MAGFEGSYTSFAGVDVRAVMGSTVIAELQAISYSVTREKAPNYTMGQVDPRGISRGKRGIAGTMVIMMFDRHALLNAMAWKAGGAQFYSDIDDIRPEFARNVNSPGAVNDLIADAENDLTSASTRTVASPVEEQETLPGGAVSDQQWATPWYADQIWPFDITLAAATEYGSLAVMRIYAAEILNEAYGTSIDDINSSMTHTYIARHVVGWRSLGRATGYPATTT